MGTKIVLYNSNLCIENSDSRVFLYYCLFHQVEAQDITGKGVVSNIPNRNILLQTPQHRLTREKILNISSPWIPVTCLSGLSDVSWDKKEISGTFNAEHRDVIGESGVYHLRYQRWQLYTFLNDSQLIDRSISGYWQRVPKDLYDILSDTNPPAMPPPPALGP